MRTCLETRPEEREWRREGFWLGPEFAVQGAVADGFKHVVGGDSVMTAKVCQGAGDLEDPIMRTGAEVHFTHGVLETASRFGIEFAMFFDEARRHGAVGMDAGVPGVALLLHGAGGFNALTYGLRGFAFVPGGKGLVVHQGNLHMKVNAIQQGTANALTITLDDSGAAAAFTL